jgi:hypothetical protein
MRNSGNIYMHVIAAGADWMSATLPTVSAIDFQDILPYSVLKLILLVFS